MSLIKLILGVWLGCNTKETCQCVGHSEPDSPSRHWQSKTSTVLPFPGPATNPTVWRAYVLPVAGQRKKKVIGFPVRGESLKAEVSRITCLEVEVGASFPYV